MRSSAEITSNYITHHFPSRDLAQSAEIVLDREYCIKVADWFEEARSASTDTVLREMYSQFKRETMQQYLHLKGNGISVEPWTYPGQPYHDSSTMCEDIARTNKVYVYLTKNGHGEGVAIDDHPMREQALVENETDCFLYNDLFRAVHDYFGHYIPENDFSTAGEFKATYAHCQMYSEEVYPVLLAETIGQICWFYCGPHLRSESGNLPSRGEDGFVSPRDRPFSDQKVVAFPDDLVKGYLYLFSNER